MYDKDQSGSISCKILLPGGIMGPRYILQLLLALLTRLQQVPNSTAR